MKNPHIVIIGNIIWLLTAFLVLIFASAIFVSYQFPEYFKGEVLSPGDFPSIYGNNISEGNESCDDGNNKELTITEIMFNPQAVDDVAGEYIEISNTSKCNNDQFKIDLFGHTLKTFYWEHEINEHILVNRNDIVVLGNNDHWFTNGNVEIDYQYTPNWYTINNYDDSVSITDPEGNELDSVSIKPLIHTISKGSSAGLKPNAWNSKDNDRPENWCEQKRQLGGEDMGSPGKMNTVCDF